MINSYSFIPAKIVIDVVPPNEVTVPVDLLTRLLAGDVVEEEIQRLIPQHKKICLTNGSKVKIKVDPNHDKHFICPQFVSSNNEFEIEKIDNMTQLDHVRIVLAYCDTRFSYEGSIANIVDVFEINAESGQEVVPELSNHSSDGGWIKWDGDNDDGPELSYKTKVEVKFKNGELSEIDYVATFNWGIYDYEYDIEFYRIVSD